MLSPPAVLPGTSDSFSVTGRDRGLEPIQVILYLLDTQAQLRPGSLLGPSYILSLTLGTVTPKETRTLGRGGNSHMGGAGGRGLWSEDSIACSPERGSQPPHPSPSSQGCSAATCKGRVQRHRWNKMTPLLQRSEATWLQKPRLLTHLDPLLMWF